MIKFVIIIIMKQTKFFLLLLAVRLTFSSSTNSICDKVFDETTIEKFGNKFEGPYKINARPFKISPNSNATFAYLTNNTQNDYQQVHCIYKFIARTDNEQVMLNFTSFKLRGSEPECSKEYLEVFAQPTQNDLDIIKNSDSTPLIERSPISGRFCTSIAPRNLVSLNNIIVLNFHSILKLPLRNSEPLFAGTFEFVNKNHHETSIGRPLDGTLCTHLIHSSKSNQGTFQSNTYPGLYIRGLKCLYKFIGEPNQRIRLEFLDLDLYSGGSHCPADYIKIYDGLDETDALINTICGSHKSLVIFSSGPSLLLKFTTFEQEINISNRGFSAHFEFSEKFVNLQFIAPDSFARHIRGSECDQRIISHRLTSGTIISPLTPHLTNTICRYIFEGLQNPLNYEKVSLKFIEFDLKTPKQLIGSTLSQQQQQETTTPVSSLTTSSSYSASESNASTANSATSASNSSLEQCSDNYLRLYTGELKLDQRQDPNDYDYMYCSDELPQPIESDAASLLMEYNSGLSGGFFKADYSFIIDFRIPGNQTSQECEFVYKSDNQKSGTFNSPWHPSWYMNDVNCTFTFIPHDGEALLLQFNSFKMFNETIDDSVGGYNEMCLFEDRIEIYEIDLNDQKVVDQKEIGIYCATSAPGPILSYRPVRIVFKSNKQKTAYGFSAIYNFYPISRLSSNEFVTNCGGQITPSPRFKSGVIASPPTYKPELYEKRHHICVWQITARPTFKIQLNFDIFELEGTQKVRGCNKAILRLNLGNSTKRPLEFCGSKTPSGDTMIASSYLSDGEKMIVTFISTKQASGSFGFKATWSEVKKSS